MINLTDAKLRYQRIADYGRTTSGGYSRIAMTQDDINARKELSSILLEIGIETTTDNAGCMWAVKKGSQPQLPTVLIGSHIDTVYNGGAYDGLLGVMAGVEVLFHLAKNNIPHKRNIAILVLSTEESTRFNSATVGSKLLTGIMDGEKIKTLLDKDGVSLYDAMAQWGFNADNLEEERKTLKGCDSFFELHIEQGPRLEAENVRIGVVEAIAAPTRVNIEIYGNADHSGACPMHLRKDALAAASHLVLEVEKLGRAESIFGSVATVTRLSIPNESLNVVPGMVNLWIDIRGINMESINRIYEAVQVTLGEVAEERRLTYSLKLGSQDSPVSLDPTLIELIEASAQSMGLSSVRMPSGAGHDAMNIAYVIPSAMIFVPCKGGISHNPAESITDQAFLDGMNLLYQVVTKRAGV